MQLEPIKQQLRALAQVLEEHAENDAAQVVRQSLAAPEQRLQVFLVSNDLWGGMGSIADQAGIDQGRDARKQIETVLIRLGVLQVKYGLINVRTESWVATFSEWQRKGI